MIWRHAQKLLFRKALWISLFMYHWSLSKTECLISKLIASWATQCEWLSLNLIIASRAKAGLCQIICFLPPKSSPTYPSLVFWLSSLQKQSFVSLCLHSESFQVNPTLSTSCTCIKFVDWAISRILHYCGLVKDFYYMTLQLVFDEDNFWHLTAYRAFVWMGKGRLPTDTAPCQGAWLGEWRKEYGFQPPLALSAKCPCALNNQYSHMQRHGLYT